MCWVPHAVGAMLKLEQHSKKHVMQASVVLLPCRAGCRSCTRDSGENQGVEFWSTAACYDVVNAPIRDGIGLASPPAFVATSPRTLSLCSWREMRARNPNKRHTDRGGAQTLGGDFGLNDDGYML